MKHSEFFKHNFSFQQKISSDYAAQALRYQFRHNQKHPDRRIWRHLLYPRTFYFLHNGIYLCVHVEIVRFRYAGTNRTFTFYGNLFLAFSSFSSDFVRQAVSEAHSLDGLAASVVSKETLNRWMVFLSKAAFSDICCTQDHKPDPSQIHPPVS